MMPESSITRERVEKLEKENAALRFALRDIAAMTGADSAATKARYALELCDDARKQGENVALRAEIDRLMALIDLLYSRASDLPPTWKLLRQD